MHAVCRYGDGQFDAAFIAFTLELFDDQDIPRVLEQIGRVLRPGGRLRIVAMSAEQITVMTDVYVWMHRHFPHWVDCRPIPVGACLAQSAFVVEHTETLWLWDLPVAVVLARRSG